MSRNNKSARRVSERKAWTKQRQSGSKGPARTVAKHGKINVRWKTKEVRDARLAIMAKARGDMTVLEKLNAEKAKSRTAD